LADADGAGRGVDTDSQVFFASFAGNCLGQIVA